MLFSRFDKPMLEQYQKDADELGITLTEYLLYRILDKLDNLHIDVEDLNEE